MYAIIGICHVPTWYMMSNFMNKVLCDLGEVVIVGESLDPPEPKQLVKLLPIFQSRIVG